MRTLALHLAHHLHLFVDQIHRPVFHIRRTDAALEIAFACLLYPVIYEDRSFYWFNWPHRIFLMIWQYPVSAGTRKDDHHRFLLASEGPFRKKKGGGRQTVTKISRDLLPTAPISVLHSQVPSRLPITRTDNLVVFNYNWTWDEGLLLRHVIMPSLAIIGRRIVICIGNKTRWAFIHLGINPSFPW